MEDLKDVGIPKSIAKFIYNSVTCKHIFFNTDGDLVGPRISTVGLPQGCILGPILFFLYTRKLYGLLLTGCTIIEFADDIVILLRSKNPRRCIRALQRCLNLLTEFLSQRGLEIFAADIVILLRSVFDGVLIHTPSSLFTKLS